MPSPNPGPQQTTAANNALQRGFIMVPRLHTHPWLRNAGCSRQAALLARGV